MASAVDASDSGMWLPEKGRDLRCEFKRNGRVPTAASGPIAEGDPSDPYGLERARRRPESRPIAIADRPGVRGLRAPQEYQDPGCGLVACWQGSGGPLNTSVRLPRSSSTSARQLAHCCRVSLLLPRSCCWLQSSRRARQPASPDSRSSHGALVRASAQQCTQQASPRWQRSLANAAACPSRDGAARRRPCRCPTTTTASPAATHSAKTCRPSAAPRGQIFQSARGAVAARGRPVARPRPDASGRESEDRRARRQHSR